MAERRQDTHRLTAMNTVMALYRNGEDILIPDHMSVIDTMKMKPPARMTMRAVVNANSFSGVEFGDVYMFTNSWTQNPENKINYTHE